MNDAEVRAGWRNLGIVVAELRNHGQAAVADQLVEGVQCASTSGEIYSGVGHTLMQHRVLRKSLTSAGSAAWAGALDDIDRAHGMPGYMRWLMRLWRKL
ncbi:MAG TPA: hypothetical protein VEQ87_14865 [Burkholderiales bacterium]|nr:hypothetical protein [Burkholderiales bacterium]